MSRKGIGLYQFIRRKIRLAPARTLMLAVVAGLLTPSAAFALELNKHLDIFAIRYGEVWSTASDDNGFTWSAWNAVPSGKAGGGTSGGFKEGNPAAASDQDGRLFVVAQTHMIGLAYNVWRNGTWDGWKTVPGSYGEAYPGLGGIALHTWVLDSNPAVTSSGPGHLEVFRLAKRSDGTLALVMTSMVNNQWSGTWQKLHAGSLHGSPAAVSWAGSTSIPGATHVVVKKDCCGLIHAWSKSEWRSWGVEQLSDYSDSSPSVASVRPGQFAVFNRSVYDKTLKHRWYENDSWSDWEYSDAVIGDAPVSISAVSRESSDIEVYAIGSDRRVWRGTLPNSRDATAGLSPLRTTPVVPDSSIAAVYWSPNKRLDTLRNRGSLQHRWTFDGGRTWSDWHFLPISLTYPEVRPFVPVGAAGVASDQPGRLTAVAKATDGTIAVTQYSSRLNKWSGWTEVMQTAQKAPGGVNINGIRYTWKLDSSPALSSRGPRQLEVFMHAVRATDGAVALVHTWTDESGNWPGRWELLATGWMQGSPTAISWGPGRTDVFVRGGGNELAHKWFANGSWSSGWEYLDGCIASSPSVATPDGGWLDVYARSCDGALYHRPYGPGGWQNWWLVPGAALGASDGNTVAATSRGPGLMDVFFFGPDQISLYQRAYSWFAGWGNFNYLEDNPPSPYPSLYLTAIYWTS